MIPQAGWVNSSRARAPGRTGAFLAATSEAGSNCSRRGRLASRSEADGPGLRAGVRAAASAGWAAGAERSCLRLLLISTENPAPAVNSHNTSTRMATVTPSAAPNVPDQPERPAPGPERGTGPAGRPAAGHADRKDRGYLA